MCAELVYLPPCLPPTAVQSESQAQGWVVVQRSTRSDNLGGVGACVWWGGVVEP